MAYPITTPGGNTWLDTRFAEQGGMNYWYQIGAFNGYASCAFFYAAPGVVYTATDIDNLIAAMLLAQNPAPTIQVTCEDGSVI